MEKNMGKYYIMMGYILGLYRNNEKEHANYYNRVSMSLVVFVA